VRLNALDLADCIAEEEPKKKPPPKLEEVVFYNV
jgi:hypothetical protein